MKRSRGENFFFWGHSQIRLRRGGGGWWWWGGGRCFWATSPEPPPPTFYNHQLMTSFLSEGGGIISTWQLHLCWSASILDTGSGFDTWQDIKVNRSLWERREFTSRIPQWITENWWRPCAEVCVCGIKGNIWNLKKSFWKPCRGEKKSFLYCFEVSYCRDFSVTESLVSCLHFKEPYFKSSAATVQLLSGEKVEDCQRCEMIRIQGNMQFCPEFSSLFFRVCNKA